MVVTLCYYETDVQYVRKSDMNEAEWSGGELRIASNNVMISLGSDSSV